MCCMSQARSLHRVTFQKQQHSIRQMVMNQKHLHRVTESLMPLKAAKWLSKYLKSTTIWIVWVKDRCKISDPSYMYTVIWMWYYLTLSVKKTKKYTGPFIVMSLKVSCKYSHGLNCVACWTMGWFNHPASWSVKRWQVVRYCRFQAIFLNNCKVKIL